MLKRRSMLLGSLAALALSPLDASANPWAPRKLAGWELSDLTAFSHKLVNQFPEIRDKTAIIDDHIRVRLEEDALYKPGTAELSVDGVRLLTLIAERMKTSKIRMEAVGHHHSDGQSYRSFIISERRATAVVAAMASRKIEKERLLATGLGENFPIASNLTETGRRANRRTELLFRLL